MWGYIEKVADQPRKGVLSRTWPCWYPDRGLPAPTAMGRTCSFFKPPSLRQPRLPEIGTSEWRPLLWASRHWLSLSEFHFLRVVYDLYLVGRLSAWLPPLDGDQDVAGLEGPREAWQRVGCKGSAAHGASVLWASLLTTSSPLTTSECARCPGTLVSKRNLRWPRTIISDKFCSPSWQYVWFIFWEGTSQPLAPVP